MNVMNNMVERNFVQMVTISFIRGSYLEFIKKHLLFYTK